MIFAEPILLKTRSPDRNSFPVTADFSIPCRIYYEDTDAGGVVYYANYLKFMERARTEWLRALGFEQDELMKREGVVFVVVNVNMDLLKPARFNDQITVTAEPVRKGAASVRFHQEIVRNDELLVRAEVRLACVDVDNFVPKQIPQTIYDAVMTGDS